MPLKAVTLKFGSEKEAIRNWEHLRERNWFAICLFDIHEVEVGVQTHTDLENLVKEVKECHSQQSSCATTS